MARIDDSKLRLLLVERMLRYDRFITADEILSKLAKRCIYADRKTIYSDIYAIDRIIPVEVKTGKNGGFRLVNVLEACDDA